MSVPNPFVHSDTGKSAADDGQRVNPGKGGTLMNFNPATTEGLSTNTPDRLASLDIISLG